MMELNIPKEIRYNTAFCLAGNGNGGFANKQPLTISDGKLISANKDGQWKLHDYYALMQLMKNNPHVQNQVHDAVGFLCPPELLVIDIDGHGEEGLSDGKKEFVEQYGCLTYCEKSLSGNGYHLIFRCDSPLSMGKLNADFGVGLTGVEIFGGIDCQTHIILTGNKIPESPIEITELPLELRKDILKNAQIKRMERSGNSLTNISTELLSKINKNPVQVICELFEGSIESESHKETRCITNMFEQKFGVPAHHFGVKPDGTWCLYGNNMRGGSLLEAVAVVKGYYDFGTGNIPTEHVSTVADLTKQLFNLTDTIDCSITINRGKSTRNLSLYKPYYETIKDRLPSLMQTYVDAVYQKTDAYKEYSMVCSLFLATICTLGRATYYPDYGYSNLTKKVSFRTFIIGKSSVSRKSTSVRQCSGCLEDIEKYWVKHALHIDPENSNAQYAMHTYYAKLANTFTEARLLQDYNDNNNCYLVNDECAGMLRDLRRDYNAAMRDEFCKLADGDNIHKALKKSKRSEEESDFKIINPIFNSLLATTPDAFQGNVSEEDAKSGYLYRFLFCCPSYSRKSRSRAELRKNRAIAETLMKDAVEKYGKMYMYFYNLTEPKYYEFTDEALEFLDDWSTKNSRANYEETELSIQARFEEAVYSLSILLHCLDEEYDDSIIDIEDVEIAVELIDNLFRPSSKHMMTLLFNSNLEKVRNLIRNKCGEVDFVSHSELLRSSHMTSKDFKTCIDTLIECGELYNEITENGQYKTVFYQWIGD